MLMENEHNKPVDRAHLPYQQLAVAVIETALVDFGVTPASQRRSRGRPLGRLDQTIVGRLSTLRLQILAGAFLVERNDDAALMWFRLSGLNYHEMRRRKPHWPTRLRVMREREAKLATGLRQALQKQMAINREVGRGEATRDSSVGRHVVEPGAVPGRGLREADRVGANGGDRPEDVLRRTGGTVADFDRRTEWPRGGAYGRLVGTLGDLPRLRQVPSTAGERLAC